MTDPTTPLPPPGWYADPTTGRQRWWDGTSWGPFADDESRAAPGAVAGYGVPGFGAPGYGSSGTGPIGYGMGAYPPRPSKDKVVAGVLAILLGSLGVHKFYLGRTGAGAIMLTGTIVGVCGSFLIIPILAAIAVGVIALVEGIIYLTKDDAEFQQIYVVQGKDWF